MNTISSFQPPEAHLNVLSRDSWVGILKKIPPKDLYTLRCTCKAFRDMLNKSNIFNLNVSHAALHWKISRCDDQFQPAKHISSTYFIETANFMFELDYFSLKACRKDCPEKGSQHISLPGEYMRVICLGNDNLDILCYSSASKQYSKAQIRVVHPDNQSVVEAKLAGLRLTHEPASENSSTTVNLEQKVQTHIVPKNLLRSYFSDPYFISENNEVYFRSNEELKLVLCTVPLAPTEKIRSIFLQNGQIWILCKDAHEQKIVQLTPLKENPTEFERTWYVDKLPTISPNRDYDFIANLVVRFSRVELILHTKSQWEMHEGWNEDDGFEVYDKDLFIFDLKTRTCIFKKDITNLRYYSVQREAFIYLPCEFRIGISTPKEIAIQMIASNTNEKVNRALGFAVSEMHIDAENYQILLKAAADKKWHKIDTP